MNVDIAFKGNHITFSPEEILLEGQTVALLADIQKTMSVEPGRTITVPTPIAVKGDGMSIGLMEIHAGRYPREEGGALEGRFIIPPTDRHVTVDVEVVNDTSAIIIIQPGVRLGVLTFQSTATSTTEELVEEGRDIPMAATYKPEHIDPAVVPAYASEGASGIDLRADIAKTVLLAAGEQMLIPTGFSIAMPQGIEGQVRPRSGLAAKHGITIVNTPGTIDSDYRGEIKVILRNGGKEDFEINPGERIAQFVLAPVLRGAMEFGDTLDETTRGEGGFGSTGRA
jgi:dUTP pyrophosphatase